MQINKIKDKIKETIKDSLNYELYHEQEDTLCYDDYEREVYQDKIDKIHEFYEKKFRFVRNADVVELKDNELKVQIFNNMQKGKVLKHACKCLNIENMKLYNLTDNTEIQATGDTRLAYVFCNSCEEHSGIIYYHLDVD